MAEKFKVGDKVRILDKDEIVGAESFGFKTNEIYPVVRLDSQGDPVITNGTKELSFFTSELQYLEKVSDKPTKNQRISALEKEVERIPILEKEIELLKAYLEKFLEIRKPTGIIIRNPFTIEQKLTPNQKASANSLRKAIIDEAKAFVEDGAKVDLSLDRGRGYVKNSVICNVDFIVNAEKRTVVAILRWRYNGNIEAKGIAKCAPDDVFNEHIGKAIALGRALGLDVSKFENAVKPTEVVVGMRVTNIPNAMYETTEGSYVVGRIKDGNAYDAYTKDGEGWIPVNLLQILDDTEAQYE